MPTTTVLASQNFSTSHGECTAAVLYDASKAKPYAVAAKQVKPGARWTVSTRWATEAEALAAHASYLSLIGYYLNGVGESVCRDYASGNFRTIRAS